MKSGDLKGAGTPGTVITEDYLNSLQRLIDQVNVHFLKAVASGRRLTLDKTCELATGETFAAPIAHKHRLIDEIGSLDDVLKELCVAAPKPVASFTALDHEIRQACPGCSDAFVEEMRAQKASLAAVRSAWDRQKPLTASKGI